MSRFKKEHLKIYFGKNIVLVNVEYYDFRSPSNSNEKKIVLVFFNLYVLKDFF